MKTSIHFIVLLAGIAAGSADAQTSIGTLGVWDGHTGIGFLGYGQQSTFGQVITVPLAQSTLYDFSLAMQLPGTENFQAYVFAWNGTTATGQALYASPVTAANGSGNYQTLSFDTGGISVTPGAQYVLVTSVLGDTGSGAGNWGEVPVSSYSGGGLVIDDTDTTVAGLSGGDWANFQPINCGAFSASFVPVPEPTSLALLGLGVATLAGLRRRKP